MYWVAFSGGWTGPQLRALLLKTHLIIIRYTITSQGMVNMSNNLTFEVYGKTITFRDDFNQWYKRNLDLEQLYSSIIFNVERQLICGEYNKISFSLFSNGYIDRLDQLVLEYSKNHRVLDLKNDFDSTGLVYDLYRMLLNSTRIKKHIQRVMDASCGDELYVDAFIPTYLRCFYICICEECIKTLKKESLTFGFVKNIQCFKFKNVSKNTLVKAWCIFPLYETTYEWAYKQGWFDQDVYALVEYFKLNLDYKTDEQKQIEKDLKEKIVNDVMDFLDMNRSKLQYLYKNKSVNDIVDSIQKDRQFNSELFDADVLTCLTMRLREFDLYKIPDLETYDDVLYYASRILYYRTNHKYVEETYETQNFIRDHKNDQLQRKIKKIVKKGMLVLILCWLVRACWAEDDKPVNLHPNSTYYYSNEKKDTNSQTYNSYSSSSSSSDSYDDGYDDAYSGDYDQDRYDSDYRYKDGVDDAMEDGY